MEKLARLFGRSIRFAYHCFDRIMIRGYLSALSRPENIVYFFRTIKQVECIRNAQTTNRSVSELGQCLHQQPSDPHHLGTEGRAQEG